jgi:alpha-tubulin suppressor-like RCC1 family protein/tRNA A-37 threonylcarbamoyl transferase component Bud32
LYLIKFKDDKYSGIGTLSRNKLLSIFLVLILMPTLINFFNEAPDTDTVPIAAGESHTCAILDNGSVSCWGSNWAGQLGNGATTDRLTPTQTSSLGEGRTAVAITAGNAHTCAILDDGSVSCWGYNAYGRLGDGTTNERNTPTQTSSLGFGRTAVAINAGNAHTCAILDDGSVSCWGFNAYGRLGDGTTNERNTPTQTDSLGTDRTAVAITAGEYHTCAILDDGSVSCWGRNYYGQIGDGTTTDRNTPTQTSSLGVGRTAVAITGGNAHTCAILDDRSVSCWGSNGDGQLGDGTYTNRNTPTQTFILGEGRTAVAISAGYAHTCAILDDGSVSCWGRNNYGQLGDGTNNERNTPTQTSSLGVGRTAVAITAGNAHTCAILDDGSVSCWGRNANGQLGDGTYNDRNVPFTFMNIKYYALISYYFILCGFFLKYKLYQTPSVKIQKLEDVRIEADRLEAEREAERIEAERIEAEKKRKEAEKKRKEAEMKEREEFERMKELMSKYDSNSEIGIIRETKQISELEEKYTRLELIGEGGMANVHRANTIENGKQVVWKEAASSRFNPLPEVNRRLLDESEILSNLDHPRIPKHIDSGEIQNDNGENIVVMIMEFIEGRSLKDDIETLAKLGKGFDSNEAIEIISKICLSLEYMADLEVPVYHRDIKPANIIIENNRGPILIDFGLAKGVDAGSDMSLSQGLSEGWSPPERRDGISGGFTDVYSLGQTLWQMLTGERPFHALSKDEIIEKLVERNHPEWVAEVILASAQRYDRRIQSVFEFRIRLENEGNYQE